MTNTLPNSKGFTLIELAVVLAIIATLAAIMTPMVTGYLDQARISRAEGEVRTIADSIKLHQRDTGRFPIYATPGQYSGTVGGGAGDVFGGPGNTPANGVATWAATVSTTTLEAWVNGNFSAVSTTNTFPKAGFRGPYVGRIDSDPWGDKYLLTALYLNSTTNHAFVISAGPNGVLDTSYTQVASATLSVGVDDIVSIIR